MRLTRSSGSRLSVLSTFLSPIGFASETLKNDDPNPRPALTGQSLSGLIKNQAGDEIEL